MNKVERIKADIDRLQETTMDENRNFLSLYHEGIFDGLSMIDNFIDSFEEEPVSNDLEEAAHSYVDTTIEWFDSEGNPCCYPAFIAGAQWQKEQIVLNDNNKEYHRVPSTTLKRLYMNETKYELLKSDIIEGIVGDFEKGTIHNYLTIKIPMLLCPSDCAKGDKVKLIIVKEE